MRKTCVKPVDGLGTSWVNAYNFCTKASLPASYGEHKSWFILSSLPTVPQAFSTFTHLLLTLVVGLFSTLSTRPITTTTISNKYLYSK